ncbi:MAG: hypothetical protein R3C71_13255 [Candidatus Krumholzibacteriia bacterium]
MRHNANDTIRISFVSARRGIALSCGALLLVLAAQTARAAGTPAGVQISNQATASYRVGASNFAVNSNTTLTQVAEILDLELTWQDAGDVPVMPGDTDRLLTFRLSNTGNGQDSYALSADGALAGDDFDPSSLTVYLDLNGNGLFEPGTDPVYVPGSNDPLLAADGSLLVFLAGAIPAGVLEGDRALAALDASSLTGTGSPGDVLAGAGEGGADAVVGSAGGTAVDQGAYVVVTVVLSIVKGAVISDPYGGSEPIPGAVITYTLTVTATGSGTALDVVISDPVPLHTAYHGGTLALDGGFLTDAADADAGDVGGSTPGAVTVQLGNLPAGAPAHVITFDVGIN